MLDCLDLGRRDHMRLFAARGRHLRLAVPNTHPRPRSILPDGERFADPELGEFVLARDALGVDPQQDVYAVSGPLGHLGGVDAAVQPGGQAGMPQVVRAPGERRGLFGCGEGHLARFDPGAPVVDRGQLAAAHPTEEAAVVCCAEVRQMMPQEPLPSSVHSLPASGVAVPKMQLAPIFSLWRILPFLTVLVPRLRSADPVVVPADT
jgi:hypothetical protein